MALKKDQIAATVFSVMGHLSAISIDMHSMLVAINNNSDGDVKISGILLSNFKKIRESLLSSVSALDRIIQDFEAHHAELTAQVFQQKPPPEKN